MVFVLRFHRPCFTIYLGWIYFFLRVGFKVNMLTIFPKKSGMLKSRFTLKMHTTKNMHFKH